MTRITDLARINLVDATTISALATTALASINDSMGGYPTSTPGAAPASTSMPPIYNGPCQEPGCEELVRPCPDHDTPVTLTGPERMASTKPDPAAADLARLKKDLAAANVLLARCARIMVRWGLPAINDQTVAQRLAAIDEGIWCKNCTRHGQHNPRRENYVDCSFCGAFLADYGLPASRAIWDARDARGGRIYVQDIERILDRDSKGWRKRRPKPKAAPVVAAPSPATDQDLATSA